MPQKVITILTFRVSDTSSNKWSKNHMTVQLAAENDQFRAVNLQTQQTVTRRGTLHGANQHKTINGYVEYQGWEILGFLLPDSFVCTIHCALHTNPSRTSNEHMDTGIKQSSIPGKALVIYSRQLAGNMFHEQAFLHATLFRRDTHECTHNHS